MTTYWYCEYMNEEYEKYSIVCKSNNSFPNIVDMIPNIGAVSATINILFEIDKKNYETIYSRMSGFKSGIEGSKNENLTNLTM